jgi:DNA-binding CsgD family transcriptional regulator
LTPSEVRIARRAAAGASNTQIAADLDLTRKTIEWHLANVFRKLDITSRSQLSAALDTDAYTANANAPTGPVR